MTRLLVASLAAVSLAAGGSAAALLQAPRVADEATKACASVVAEVLGQPLPALERTCVGPKDPVGN